MKSLFKLNNQHDIIVLGDSSLIKNGGGSVSCESCSLSWVTHNAVKFMVEFGVSKMTVDGAELVKVY